MNHLTAVTSALAAALLAIALLTQGCSQPAPRLSVPTLSPAPSTPKTLAASLPPETARALDTAISALDGDLSPTHIRAIQAIGDAGDPRTAWLLSDLLRLARHPLYARVLVQAADTLLSTSFDGPDHWNDLTNHLMAQDIPAPPDYLARKRAIYTRLVPEWSRLFTEPSEVDWRFVSWGGVDIDDRPYDQTDEPCNCIPATDNPAVTSAAKGAWLQDNAVIFGVSINGEARAYPRFIMEIREMVNDTLGGRSFGMPYCTLCGAAQVWFTDRVPPSVKRPVLRTSGLLTRSNKLMYDITSWSVLDTFRGNALSGPLLAKNVQLQPHSVVTTTWGEWKRRHPHTTLLARSLALGRNSDLRNTRDADGPIFPIGQVDPRLPVQADVLGVITRDGTPISFPVDAAIATLQRGQPVTANGLTLHLDGGGLTARNPDGSDAGAHQAFWFAWSQFHPKTLLWNPNQPSTHQSEFQEK